MTVRLERTGKEHVGQRRSAARPGAFFLPINSVLQSSLRGFDAAASEPFHRQRQRRVTAIYAAAVALCCALSLSAPMGARGDALLLGLMLPGAGFGQWAAGDQAVLAMMCVMGGAAVFGVALILWFATGNILAPILIWLVLAGAAARPELLGLSAAQEAGDAPQMIVPLLLSIAGWVMLRRAPSPVAARVAVAATVRAVEMREGGEWSLEDLERMRLLFDRALQPVDDFQGFEWRDQFQTAAVRYQVQFLSYALAQARAGATPAMRGSHEKAQAQLLYKMGDRRVWRYWALENAWGNLRLNDDPVRHQNIMFSGFTALQMALGEGDAPLSLRRGGREAYRYALSDVAAVLAGQYARAPYGLLACEPGWIYPLCNLISMAGVRAADARSGTEHWAQLSANFLGHLDREATRRDGSFIAFRSSVTGFAPPSPGGIVMQAFPCLFLNSLAPDLAQEHWARVRRRLDTQDWRRLFWPIDVGNYGFSRAAGYAATAAAAREMGDNLVAAECLARLEDECPSQAEGSVIHRDGASLWAHALEIMARCGRADGLRAGVEHPLTLAGPHVRDEGYDDVHVARAVGDGRDLSLVVHPVRGRCMAHIALGGLLPDRHYFTGHAASPYVRSDSDGRGTIHAPITGRTEFRLEPVV